MGDTVIRVENLSKRYRIGTLRNKSSYGSLRESLVEAAALPFRKLHSLATGEPLPQPDEIWALKDVSFEVERGEVLGIIGRNGAGKSTLLKVLSRITKPTSGRVILRGRIGTLLEVGTGFHPELTGRENIFLNGAVLGMTRREIEGKFDEIVDFAEIGQFLETPVKFYSSGMYMRLAFAVAAHLEPEILLVDEVLAVGDVAFQKKCLGKMSQVAREGRTVLFVSHNMGAISRLCQRSLLLHQGIIFFDGISDIAVNKYTKGETNNINRRVFFKNDSNHQIEIQQVAVTTPGKDETDILDIYDPLFVEIYYRVKYDTKGTSIGFALKREGVVLFRSWDIDKNQSIFELRRKGDYYSKISLPIGLFSPGEYSVYVAVGRPGVGPIIIHDDCVLFEIRSITQDASHMSYSRGGLLVLSLSWETSILKNT